MSISLAIGRKHVSNIRLVIELDIPTASFQIEAAEESLNRFPNNLDVPNHNFDDLLNVFFRDLIESLKSIF